MGEILERPARYPESHAAFKGTRFHEKVVRFEPLAGRTVRDFWALHAESRDAVAKALG